MAKKCFCDIENCRYGVLNEFGDGWNEPKMDEWICEVERFLPNDVEEFTEDETTRYAHGSISLKGEIIDGKV